MDDMGDNRMPGQWLPTWAITLLVIAFSFVGLVVLLGLLVGN